MVKSAQTALKKTLTSLKDQRSKIDQQIKAVQTALVAIGVKTPKLAGRRRRKPMTAAERKSVSKRMKAYWAKKRRTS